MIKFHPLEKNLTNQIQPPGTLALAWEQTKQGGNYSWYLTLEQGNLVSADDLPIGRVIDGFQHLIAFNPTPVHPNSKEPIRPSATIENSGQL